MFAGSNLGCFFGVAMDHECWSLIEDSPKMLYFKRINRVLIGRFLNGLRVSTRAHNEGYA